MEKRAQGGKEEEKGRALRRCVKVSVDSAGGVSQEKKETVGKRRGRGERRASWRTRSAMSTPFWRPDQPTSKAGRESHKRSVPSCASSGSRFWRSKGQGRKKKNARKKRGGGWKGEVCASAARSCRIVIVVTGGRREKEKKKERKKALLLALEAAYHLAVGKWEKGEKKEGDRVRQPDDHDAFQSCRGGEKGSSKRGGRGGERVVLTGLGTRAVQRGRGVWKKGERGSRDSGLSLTNSTVQRCGALTM